MARAVHCGAKHACSCCSYRSCCTDLCKGGTCLAADTSSMATTVYIQASTPSSIRPYLHAASCYRTVSSRVCPRRKRGDILTSMVLLRKSLGDGTGLTFCLIYQKAQTSLKLLLYNGSHSCHQIRLDRSAGTQMIVVQQATGHALLFCYLRNADLTPKSYAVSNVLS